MRLSRSKRHARVELLPLMDVVFLILVFLVYAMMVMVVQMGMPVNLPSSKNAQPEHMVVLALTIQKDGALWLNKTPVTLDNLTSSIMAKSGNKGPDKEDEPVVQIFADAMLPYQKLFDVLDVLKKAGLKKVSLQAREEH